MAAQIPDVVLEQTYTVLDDPGNVTELPVEPLTTTYVVDQVSGVASTISNRFPVPPTAAGFLTMVDAMEETPMAFSTIQGSPIIGAFTAEGRYLEPTIGQIWPR